MKITLIFPSSKFNTLGKGGMENNWINLGLAYISSYLKSNNYEVNLIDMRELLNWEEFIEEVKKRNSDIYGIYVNVLNFKIALKCAEYIKRQNKIVVGGGPHASTMPETFLNSGYFDHIVIGEGEIAFLKLIRMIEGGVKPEPKIQGEIFEDLDKLPFPDRDLYNMEKILNPKENFPFIDNGVIIMASRGCPFNCSFCQPLIKNMFGAKIRYRSVDNVIKELKYVLDRYKVKYISFQDDTFTVRKKWLLELCGAIKKENLLFQWSAQSRVDLFDDEIARAMSQAGCVCVFFGFESGSQRILDLYRKQISPEQSVRAAEICRKNKMLIFADYMLGAPGEEIRDLELTLKMIKKIGPEITSATYFTPVPGCDLYEYCKQRNLINIDCSEGMSRESKGEKIKGVDYKILDKYKRRTWSYAILWFQEKHYMKLALARWSNLIKKGYIIDFIKELLIRSINLRIGKTIKDLLIR